MGFEEHAIRTIKENKKLRKGRDKSLFKTQKHTARKRILKKALPSKAHQKKLKVIERRRVWLTFLEYGIMLLICLILGMIARNYILG